MPRPRAILLAPHLLALGVAFGALAAPVPAQQSAFPPVVDEQLLPPPGDLRPVTDRRPREEFSLEALRRLLEEDAAREGVAARPAPVPAPVAQPFPAPAPVPAIAATPEAINAATYSGGPLPEKQSALAAKIQILLDRAGISPGVIDGVKGGMTATAIAAFERREGLPEDGILDPLVWQRLSVHDDRALVMPYTITPGDVARIGPPLPSDYALLAQEDWLHYTSGAEALAETFHMDEGFLRGLNPGARFAAGETIVVVRPGMPLFGTVTRITVDKTTRRLTAFDALGSILTSYPVTIGSASTPSPSGTVVVEAIAREPTYHYNPENFVQGENLRPLTLPPGPNGPVGLVWIDLSKPSYGLHGTPDPSGLFRNRSHGCVRLTNWDAMELAGMVRKGTVVEFLD